MCTHQCCVLIEDIFIHLVMRFPGTETRIKKNQNKTCVHNCVVNPQRNLVKLNTQNGIGLNVFFLVGTICKHQNTQQFHHGRQILKFKKKKEVEFKWLPTCSVCDTVVSQEVIQQLIVLFHIKACYVHIISLSINVY